MRLPKYTIGVGDRFGQQMPAQLRACQLAALAGIDLSPVWNKSNREHLIIGSEPAQTRAAADRAVQDAGWTLPYFVDADHIRLDTYARYVEPCDFFTIDVADWIGRRGEPAEVAAFLHRHPELFTDMHIDIETRPSGIAPASSKEAIAEGTRLFLPAVREAGRVYRAIRLARASDDFVVEISMDETAEPQTPTELLVILAAAADEGIPVNTIAPKFAGRFNKGVDFEGDISRFAAEFRASLATLAVALRHYRLPPALKLSVHSGSDKFSIYPAIQAALRETGAGIHVKTAGTTWLEEMIGLAEAGGDGFALAQEIYAEAYAQVDELCAPYAAVVAIDRSRLPLPTEVRRWSGQDFVAALRHNSPREPQTAAFNPHLRQLLHVGFKVAAKMGSRWIQTIQSNQALIARNVTHNLFDRHIQPIFLGA